MVKMQEKLAEGRKRSLVAIWHDTTWKLALLFFPLVALVMVDAREIIVLLFTSRYLASVPICIAWSSMILLTALQVDGVLRVFAQTRFLLVLNVMRLVILAGLLQWSLSRLHLLGAALVCVLATFAFKAVALVRMRTLMQTSASELLPWRRLAGLLAASGAGAAAALAVKWQLAVSGVPMLFATAIVLGTTYCALVWCFGLLGAGERLALLSLARRVRIGAAQVLDYSKG
jgi:hypothetical protein